MTKKENPAKSKSTETQLQIWGLPEELKPRFKAKCAANGVTMKDVIWEFMEKYTKA